MKVAIVIATHGSAMWRDLAWSRAYPSAETQGADEILIEHEPDATRAEVRNRLTERAEADWIVTLDADDELAPGYVDAIRAVADGTPSLLTPMVVYVRGRRPQAARFWPEIDLRKGNWMVVGTAFPRNLMLSLGGWRTFMGTGKHNEYDDYDLWIRMTQAGCQVVKVPKAIYVAHIGPHSAHRRAQPAIRRAWHREIEAANWPDEPSVL